MTGLQLLPIPGIPEVRPGDDLGALVADGALASVGLLDGDVVVVTQKVVSKAENALVAIDPTDPHAHRRLVAGQSRRILRRRGDLVISETHHGYVCANAGIDVSNVEPGTAALLPEDSDRSARRLRDVFVHRYGIACGVIVSDTFGRPWRRGVTDVALGSAGIRPILDLRGTNDALGRELAVTEVGLVDELAGAADLVMGKSSGIAAAIVRGVEPAWLDVSDLDVDGVVPNIVRSPAEDLFR
ncbi:MAG: coenzyme F420-0:L-glutamate ligase [Candidatus Microthrix sp.]|uniref:F420-dependent oxidoreductase n=1 Tax=Candidatus Neomicrothrix parvicella RN1 TaxID=1229780 RepID=R4YVW6_9ACTN